MKKQEGFTLVELLTVIVVVPLVLGIFGGIGYVIFHFIAKFW